MGVEGELALPLKTLAGSLSGEEEEFEGERDEKHVAFGCGELPPWPSC